MFESRARLKDDIERLIEAIRVAADGRYACVMEPGTILFETPEPEGREIATLRRLLDLHSTSIFALPAAMEREGAGPETDPFEGWEHDDLLLVFLNDRVALALACGDAEAGRAAIEKPLRILVDRLLRYNPAYRMDQRGRGFFAGRPKLDFVTIARGG
jgi:hypothetical protein